MDKCSNCSKVIKYESKFYIVMNDGKPYILCEWCIN